VGVGVGVEVALSTAIGDIAIWLLSVETGDVRDTSLDTAEHAGMSVLKSKNSRRQLSGFVFTIVRSTFLHCILLSPFLWSG
jgi:hypothetical protein